MGALTRTRRRALCLALLLAGTAGVTLAHAADPRPGIQSARVFGDYLVARNAEHAGDWDTAARMYRLVWEQAGDADALRRAFLFSLGSGDSKSALNLARSIAPDAAESALAQPLLLAEALKHGDARQQAAKLAALPDHGMDRPMRAIIQAWFDAPHDVAKARHDLDALGELPELEATQQALLAERFGTRDEADAAYATLARDHSSPRILTLAYDYQMRTGRPAAAQALLAALSPSEAQDPATASVLAALAGGKLRPAARPDATAGLAEGLHQMAELMLQAQHPDVALFYAQIGAYLAPGPSFDLLVGEIESEQGRYADAARRLDRPFAGSPFAELAAMEAVSAYESAGQIDAAKAAATRLMAAEPGRPEPVLALADLLRREKHYAPAIALYATALRGKSLPADQHAQVLFARGVAEDGLKSNAAAESDLRAAVALAPKDPLILNYLGYIWAARGEKLDAARDLLERAHALAPEDPAIADSLGWALYQSGDYPGGRKLLEEAVRTSPWQSVLNEHLGDDYWRLNRHGEARDQWRHALLNAAPEDAQTLRDKLRDGLPEPAPDGHQTHAALEPLPSPSP